MIGVILGCYALRKYPVSIDASLIRQTNINPFVERSMLDRNGLLDSTNPVCFDATFHTVFQQGIVERCFDVRRSLIRVVSNRQLIFQPCIFYVRNGTNNLCDSQLITNSDLGSTAGTIMVYSWVTSALSGHTKVSLSRLPYSSI